MDELAVQQEQDEELQKLEEEERRLLGDDEDEEDEDDDEEEGGQEETEINQHVHYNEIDNEADISIVHEEMANLSIMHDSNSFDLVSSPSRYRTMQVDEVISPLAINRTISFSSEPSAIPNNSNNHPIRMRRLVLWIRTRYHPFRGTLPQSLE